MTILLIFGILCILGAAVLAVMAFLPEKNAAEQSDADEDPSGIAEETE